MNTHLFLAFSFGFSCVLSAGCTETGSEAENSLHILEPDVHVGKFKSTSSIRNVITVRNNTSKIYKLHELKLSCGCLSSNFSVTELPPGEDYTFSVNIFNALLGEGTQQGEIRTDPPLDPPLRFQIHYEVESSTYLFPDNVLLGEVSLHDSKWPKLAEFQVQSLDNEIEIIEPLRLDSAEFTYPSGMVYEIVQPRKLKQGDLIQIKVMPGEFGGGAFHDFFTLTIPAKDETRQFAIGVSGRVSSDSVALQLEL